MIKDNPNGQTQYDPIGLDGLPSDKPFEREIRYAVFKIKDVLACLEDDEIATLQSLGEKIARHRRKGEP